jgi:diaminohydroxyphosphoribosylaminopyrimidine deaminase/5-amino-6-(5-phosphoribosylamino)uracil reductase
MNVLVEAGQGVTTAFLREKLVDKLYLFYGNKILGGTKSLPFIGHIGINVLDESLILEDLAVRQFDETILIEGYLKNVYRNN